VHTRRNVVIAELEEDIIFGRLAPGTRLVEDVLMQRFGATRHFIRQALDQLERMGIVRKEPNKGARVRTFTIDEVRQIYAVRELLQRQAALLIPLPAKASLIDELLKIHEVYSRHADAGNLRGVHEMNDRFHSAIFAAAGNPYLLRSIEEYMSLTYAIRANSLAIPEQLMISRRHHAMMIELLKGRDNWTLAQLCVDHILPSKLDYLQRAHEGDNDAEQPAEVVPIQAARR
jgi:DNA-binding GntR family transcriptional regulator